MFAFHVANAWQEGNAIHLFVCVYAEGVRFFLLFSDQNQNQNQNAIANANFQVELPGALIHLGASLRKYAPSSCEGVDWLDCGAAMVSGFVNEAQLNMRCMCAALVRATFWADPYSVRPPINICCCVQKHGALHTCGALTSCWEAQPGGIEPCNALCFPCACNIAGRILQGEPFCAIVGAYSVNAPLAACTAATCGTDESPS